MSTKFFAIFWIYGMIFTSGFAQTTTNKEPLLYDPQASSSIDISKVNTYKVPNINNDSLVEIYKYYKIPPSLSLEKITGILLPAAIDLKKTGSHFRLKNGKLWLLKIYSPTAKSLGAVFKNLYIPKGATLFIYGVNKDANFSGPLTYEDNDTLCSRLDQWSNHIIIEYFEPKNIEDTGHIFINKISYGFVNPLGAQQEPNIKMKSGPYGTAVNNCYPNVSCDAGIGWNKESQAVGLIYIGVTNYATNVTTTIKGSGCFINKDQDYLETDKPYFITAGHILWGINENGFDIDKTLKNNCSIILNYASSNCDDNDGTKVAFQKITKMQKIALGGADGDNYDYAILQPIDKTVGDLRKYNVNFAGWTITHDVGGPYAMIHHPGGDIKKISKSNGIMTILPNEARVNWDLGTSEDGSSGAPVFNNEHHMNSINVAGPNGCSGNRISDLAHFAYIFNDAGLNDYLGNVTQVNTFVPNDKYLPDFCKNCVQDADKGETGVDCGGPCNPCSDIPWNVYLNEATTVLPPIINAGNEILVETTTGNVNVEDGQNVIFNAGTSVKLKNGFHAKKNSTFSAKALAYDNTPRQCKNFCLPANLYNLFCRQGGFHQFIPFVTWYEVTIYQYVQGNMIPIYTNSGPVYAQDFSLWDGKDGYIPEFAYILLNGYEQFFYDLTVRDCNGNQNRYNKNIFCFRDCEKSASPFANSQYIELSELKAYSDSTTNLLFNIYPNPTNGIITIRVNKISQQTYIVVTDILGKSVYQKQLIQLESTLDLSMLLKGVYIVKLSDDKHSACQKVIVE